MRRRLYKFMVVGWLAISIVGINSCADFDVGNLNTPDTSRVFENPDDLERVAGDTYRIIINATLAYAGPGLPLILMADLMTIQLSASMVYEFSSEPRKIFNNTIPYAYAFVNREYWQSINFALSQVNDVLIQIEGSTVIVDNATTEMVKAWCYFIQGVAHGYLALVMQKGFIVDERTNLETLEWKTYSEMGDTAIFYLDRAIEACAANDFVLPDGWIRGSNLTSRELGQLANFYAAKFLVSNSRNATENVAVDWDKVKTYSQNGLTADFTIDFDGYSTWVSRLMGFSQNEIWMRVDMRVINLMDLNYPSRWNADGTAPDPSHAISDDLRLESDFMWFSTLMCRPGRGFYNCSYYGYNRYPELIECATQAICGVLAIYPKAENDLMEAEALLRTGNKSGAIAIINAGARVTRGGLAPLDAGATEEEVLEAIFYERTIELFSHSMGTGFFDMRRRNYLQPGTLLHFPVPGYELENLGEEYYTLGGSFGIPGVDFADIDWGWPGWDIQNPYQ